jgi:hypothetical protein
MKIKYEVYFKDYWTKQSNNIGFFIDYWKEIDFERGRRLAKKHYGSMVKDPDALFVLKGRET